MDQSETRRLAHSLVTMLTLQRLLNGRRDNFERLTITMSELPSFEEKEFPYEGTNEFTLPGPVHSLDGGWKLLNDNMDHYIEAASTTPGSKLLKCKQIEGEGLVPGGVWEVHTSVTSITRGQNGKNGTQRKVYRYLAVYTLIDVQKPRRIVIDVKNRKVGCGQDISPGTPPKEVRIVMEHKVGGNGNVNLETKYQSTGGGIGCDPYNIFMGTLPCVCLVPIGACLMFSCSLCIPWDKTNKTTAQGSADRIGNTINWILKGRPAEWRGGREGVSHLLMTMLKGGPTLPGQADVLTLPGQADAVTAVGVSVVEMDRGGGKSMGDQIKELGELKAQGLMTEEEFIAAKKKIIDNN